MTSSIVVLVAGKDPLVSIGGHGTYIRAHARAVIRAGYEPHIFSVARRSELVPTGFGMLHRTGSPLWPERVWMVPAHVPPVARAVERFVRQRSAFCEVLVHSFGLWGGIGVNVAQRLRRQGIQATAIVNAYATYEFEFRARLRRLNSTHGMMQHISQRVLCLWSKHVVDRYERWGYTGSQLILVNYDSVRRLLQDTYAIGSKFRKVPYTSEAAFVCESSVRPETPPEHIRALRPPGAPLIVAVSRHDPRKGVDVLLHALARLRLAGTPFQACLVGGGPLLAADRGLATRLGLENAVTITGFVPDPYPFLQQADVFVLPSLRESSGSLSLLEALQAGAAVVASNIDGIPEDVVDEESALLVPPGDPSALAAAIERLLADPGLRKRLAAAGRVTFEARFSPDVFAEALRETYAELGFKGGCG